MRSVQSQDKCTAVVLLPLVSLQEQWGQLPNSKIDIEELVRTAIGQQPVNKP